MRTRTLAVLAVAALLVAVPAAIAGSAHNAANTTNYPDSAGEDAAAPDITSVTVSNDDAGMITFAVNIANRPQLTNDMYLLVFLDTDQNATTGDRDTLGADFVIQMVPGAADLFQWNGTDYVRAPSQASLTFGYGTTGATLRIAAADLSRTKGFKFGVIVASGVAETPTGELDFANVHTDAAPDSGHGFHTYQVLTKVVLTATAFTTSPKPAKAGRNLSVSLAATQNDTQGPVTSGTVACAASLGGKRLVAVSRVLANGIATCVWKIPKTAKGLTMRGNITLTVQGARLTRVFAVKIA